MKNLCILAVVMMLATSLCGPTAAAQEEEKLYRIGYLTASSAKAVNRRLEAFKQGMRALGFVEGRNFIVEQRHARGNRKRLPALASELVDRKVDILLTNGGSATLAAGRAASGAAVPIPVVFALAANPVETGLVASLSRPGGNITGLSNSHSILVPKRLELLKELIPAARRIAVLWSPRAKNGPSQLKSLEAASVRLGLTLIPVALEVPADLGKAFTEIRGSGAEGLNVFAWSLSARLRKQIARMALAHHLPTMHASPRNVAAGGLIGYGVNRLDLYRRAATYVDKLLKGARPADLPVEQPTKFDLVINLKTAKALGVSVPPAVLLRADRMIE